MYVIEQVPKNGVGILCEIGGAARWAVGKQATIVGKKAEELRLLVV